MRKAAVWIMAIMVAFYGVILLSSPETDTSGDPEDLAEISFEDIENNQIYYIDELIVADTHSILEDSDVKYYLVMFYDQDDNLVAANMPVNASCEIWEDLEDYLEDDSMHIGDMVISCYVKTGTDQTKTRDFFQSRVWDLELEGGFDIETVSFKFDYVCDEDGDPYETAEGVNTITKVMGVLCLAVAALIIYFGAIRKPKAKKPAAAPAAPVYTAPAAPTYTPPVRPASQPRQDSLHFSGRRTAAPAAPAGEDPVVTELKRYQALHDAGFMTDEEFEQTRRKILGL